MSESLPRDAQRRVVIYGDNGAIAEERHFETYHPEEPLPPAPVRIGRVAVVGSRPEADKGFNDLLSENTKEHIAS